ncbi:MAG TPA: cell division protein FtsB [Kangiella sp.]
MKWVALTLLVILTSLQYRMWFGQSSFREIKQQEARVELVKSENAELALRNQKILAEIHDLREGTDAIEERARYQLGMIKEGETFFRILDSREDSRQESRQGSSQEQP